VVNGNAFTDRQGTLDDEQLWLRSWSNDTYLWYDEIADQNPESFNSAEDYFDVLLTNEMTPSGSAKDNFHFYQDSEEYLQQQVTGSSSGYGIRVALIRSSPPRQAIVAFTEPSSPATDVNITRGAEILEIDGVSLVDGSDVDTLNAGLFPSSAGEQHTFVIRDLNATESRTVTLTSADVVSAPVQNTEIVQTNSGNVAYMTFNTFGTRIAEKALYDAFNGLVDQNVDDLVLDLRYNGGGFLAISSQLAYMIAGSTNTSGKTYEQTLFNDKNPTTNPVTGETLQPTPFYNTTLGFLPEDLAGGIPLPSLNLNRVFILSTGGTCSASEALINGLRGADVEVILIGGTTCGKPYGFYPTDNCGTTYFTIQFTGINNKGFGEYPDGFIPSGTNVPESVNVKGCGVADDYGNLLGNVNEAMFKTALEYRTNGNSCPPVTAQQSKTQEYRMYDPSLDLLNDPRIRRRMLLEQTRIDFTALSR